MNTSLTFRCGEQIDQREAGVGLLGKYWKSFAPKDVCEWSQRIAASGGYIVAAYVGDAIAGILEGMRLDIGGDLSRVPGTFQELTGNGTWNTHNASGDTVILVDLTIGPSYHGVGLFEAFVDFAKNTFQSPSGMILTYSPLFVSENRYWVANKHEHCGAKLQKEIPKSRPGLKMIVGGQELLAEDVGIMAYTLKAVRPTDSPKPMISSLP
jgi:hypothetical protein